MNLAKLKKEVERLAARAGFSLPKDVKSALVRAKAKEKNKKAAAGLAMILENAEIAKAQNLAICQDTGLPIVFVEAGSSLNVSYRVEAAIRQAVISGYARNYLRPSSVSPLARNKSSYEGVIVHWHFSSSFSSGMRITIFPKGFGSENKSRLKMFNPTVSFSAIEDFIVESVKEAGPEACPPFIVGVGIGGTSDQCLLLAKEALISKLDRFSAREKALLKKINSLGIGVMGLGGKTTALGVKIKTAPTHIAGLPVGVNISCHALRRASLKINV